MGKLGCSLLFHPSRFLRYMWYALSWFFFLLFYSNPAHLPLSRSFAWVMSPDRAMSPVWTKFVLPVECLPLWYTTAISPSKTLSLFSFLLSSEDLAVSASTLCVHIDSLIFPGCYFPFPPCLFSSAATEISYIFILFSGNIDWSAICVDIEFCVVIATPNAIMIILALFIFKRFNAIIAIDCATCDERRNRLSPNIDLTTNTDLELISRKDIQRCIVA